MKKYLDARFEAARLLADGSDVVSMKRTGDTYSVKEGGSDWLGYAFRFDNWHMANRHTLLITETEGDTACVRLLDDGHYLVYTEEAA